MELFLIVGQLVSKARCSWLVNLMRFFRNAGGMSVDWERETSADIEAATCKLKTTSVESALLTSKFHGSGGRRTCELGDDGARARSSLLWRSGGEDGGWYAP